MPADVSTGCAPSWSRKNECKTMSARQMGDQSARRADTIVSDELAQKFKTEKDTPYLRWVREEGLEMRSAHYVRAWRSTTARSSRPCRPSREGGRAPDRVSTWFTPEGVPEWSGRKGAENRGFSCG